jgi:hypothetical protein
MAKKCASHPHLLAWKKKNAMRLRKSLILLSIVSILVLSSHIGWIRDDLGVLLTVDERPIDIVGNIENQLNQLSRTCVSVKRLTTEDNKYQLAQSLIDSYSPPDSRFSSIASVWSMGTWLLAEVEFKELLPAVVLIQNADADAAIVPDAVWSGYTQPYLPAPFIRKFLIQQLASPPLELINCFDPQSNAFH